MNDLQVLQNYLFVSAILFCIGLVGFLSRRNMIVMFLCVEMMLQAVSLNLIAFSRYHNDWGGQMLVIFMITVATCEAAISLALVMMLFHRSGTLDITFWQNTREETVPPFVDQELPAQTPRAAWPRLTPAGVVPAPTEDEPEMRETHV